VAEKVTRARFSELVTGSPVHPPAGSSITSRGAIGDGVGPLEVEAEPRTGEGGAKQATVRIEHTVEQEPVTLAWS